MPTYHRLAPMLLTNDIRGTIDFYTVHLGFRLDGLWPQEDPCWCSLERDSVHVMFYTRDDRGPSSPVMTGRLYIGVDDVSALHQRIRNRVNVLEDLQVRFYGMHEFAIEDNNGYALTFAQPADAPPTCREH